MPFVYSSDMSTSFCWVSWKAPRGLPNWVRSAAYDCAACSEDRAAPRAPHTMP